MWYSHTIGYLVLAKGSNIISQQAATCRVEKLFRVLGIRGFTSELIYAGVQGKPRTLHPDKTSPYSYSTRTPFCPVSLTLGSTRAKLLRFLTLLISLASRRPKFSHHPLALRFQYSSSQEWGFPLRKCPLRGNSFEIFSLCSRLLKVVNCNSWSDTWGGSETPLSMWHSQVMAVCVPPQQVLKMK